jgi:phytoene/squalene synthetase
VADEIVDTFEGHDQKTMLEEFRDETYKAIDRGISTNPVLHSFQQTVNEYNIDRSSIDCFLDSMEMDLSVTNHDRASYEQYILGSAQVVGLMCLRVFCKGDQEQYDYLKDGAMALGSAFQKVNFLRDIQADTEGLGRLYFPEMDFNNLDEAKKVAIEDDIQKDFDFALEKIMELPAGSRFGVFIAYRYYLKLFNKIREERADTLMSKRLRVPNWIKLRLIFTSRIRLSLGQFEV